VTRVSGRGLEAAAWRGPWRFCGNKVTSVERVACAPLSMTESGERAEFISRSTKRRVSCGNKGILPQLRPHTEHTHRRQRTRTLLGTSMASSRAKAADQISPTTHPTLQALACSPPPGVQGPCPCVIFPPCRQCEATSLLRSDVIRLPSQITHVQVQQHQQTESLLLAPPGMSHDDECPATIYVHTWSA
jgi:hypothetical protein